MNKRLLLILFSVVVSVSCSKDNTVDSRMERIAGEYTLRAVINGKLNELYEYGYDLMNRPIGTIVKKDDGWFFDYLLPYPKKDGTIEFVNVEQPMTWDPILDAYCFIGSKPAGPDFSSQGIPLIYYDEESFKVQYGVFTQYTTHRFGRRFIHLFTWTKK